MLNKTDFILLITILFLSGCCGAPTTPADPSKTLHTEQIFSASKEKVWGATIAALTDMGATIGTMDKESGIIHTQEVAVHPNRVGDLIVKGIDTFGMTWWDSNYQINIIIIPENDNQTKVKAVSKIRVKTRGGMGVRASDLWLLKQSNGVLERTLFDKIQQKLTEQLQKTTSEKTTPVTVSKPTEIPAPIKAESVTTAQPPLTSKPETTSSETKTEKTIDEKPPVTYLITLKGCNIRSEPNTQCKIITIVTKGEKLENIGRSGNWHNVKLSSGETGWVFKDLVKEAE